jgi:hypothetical protein
MGSIFRRNSERAKKNLHHFFIRSILSLTFLLLIFGCKKKSLIEDYFPHKDGNRWKYRSSDVTGYFIREFSGATTLGNQILRNWVKTTFDTAGPQVTSATETNYVLVTDTMVIFYEDLSSDPYIYLKLPLEVDSSWTFYIDEEPIYAQVETKEEEFSVEAGEFSDVYVVKYDDPENEETRRVYYAPNAGIIKDVLADSEEGEIITDEELIEYPAKD